MKDLQVEFEEELSVPVSRNAVLLDCKCLAIKSFYQGIASRGPLSPLCPVHHGKAQAIAIRLSI